MKPTNNKKLSTSVFATKSAKIFFVVSGPKFRGSSSSSGIGTHSRHQQTLNKKQPKVSRKQTPSTNVGAFSFPPPPPQESEKKSKQQKPKSKMTQLQQDSHHNFGVFLGQILWSQFFWFFFVFRITISFSISR